MTDCPCPHHPFGCMNHPHACACATTTCLGPCLKCGAISGDDWSQCKGSCPIQGSPHYDPQANVNAGMQREMKAWMDANVPKRLAAGLTQRDHTILGMIRMAFMAGWKAGR